MNLTIDFRYTDPEIKIKGISFKALKGLDIEQRIYRGDSGEYCIDASFKINRKTAQIELSFLIKGLREIKSRIPFDKINTIGHYEASAEQILNLIKQQA